MDEEMEIAGLIVDNGVYRCPVCKSSRITEVEQCVIYKHRNVNTGKLIHPNTGKTGMSNRQKAMYYDIATADGVGCWNYVCRKCGWVSEIQAE